MSGLSVIAVLGINPVLWMIGGGVDGVNRPGLRWVRTLVSPIVIAILVTLGGGVLWWKAVSVAVALAAVNSLPYGSKTPWWIKGIVFAALSLPAWILAFKWYLPLLTAGTGLSLMKISQTDNDFTHKIFEGGMGFVQAAAILTARLSLR